MNKKKYFKELKKFISSIKLLEQRYKYLENEEKELENEYVETLKALNYDSISTSKTYKINYATEELMLQEQAEKEKRALQLHNINKEKNKIAMTISKYNSALNQLDDLEKTVITLALVERKSRVYILGRINASETSYYKIYNGAMEKMCISLYGIDYLMLDMRNLIY